MAISTVSEVDVAGTDGSADIPVQFGYDGAYTAQLSGLSEGLSIPGLLTQANGLDVFCFDLPALDHFRIATFDADTTVLGSDDLGLRLFAVDSCATFNILGQVGASGGLTSEEVIDLANSGAGADIHYMLWVYALLGDDGNATVNAPATATVGA